MSSESKKSKESTTSGEARATTPTATTATLDVAQLFETADENLTKFVNEFAKAQPEYAQAISNLQQEYIDTAREAIKIGTSVQKQLINSSNNNKIELPAITPPFIKRFVDQSKDLTSNMIGITDLNAQFAINELNATRENLKNNRRMVKAAVPIVNVLTILKFITKSIDIVISSGFAGSMMKLMAIIPA